jgi:hypothetical protein
VLGSSLVILLDGGLVDLDALGFDDSANLEEICEILVFELSEGRLSYLGLELRKVRWAEGICLGNNRNQVHSRAKSLHNFDIEGLESVAGRANEVQAGMHTEVDLVLAARLLLLKHVRLVLVVEKLDNRHPGVAVVDIVAKSGGVNNRQPNYENTLVRASELIQETLPVL